MKEVVREQSLPLWHMHVIPICDLFLSYLFHITESILVLLCRSEKKYILVALYRYCTV